MANKTFKLGEVCRGGVITVETNKTTVSVIVKDWDTSAGWNKGSNQSQAQELYRKEVRIDDGDAKNKLYMYLSDQTTSYHADKIVEWIETKVKFENKSWW